MHKNTTYNGYQNELRVTNIVKIINRLQLILIKEKLQFSIMHMPDVYSRIHLQPINQAQ